MTVHANGTGLGWDEASPDIDQPHGLDYRQHQDLRKGVRIRAEKQHTTYGGSSCGGLHKPGKASILLVETTVNFADYIVAASLCGAARYGIAYDTSGYLWHVSDNTTSFCALGINPNSLCVGANWEYSGPVKFDGSIDFSGALYVDATVDIAGYLMCGSDIGIAEHLACNSGAQFLGPVTCSTGFHCGTASCYADASFGAARFVCSSNIVFDGAGCDFSGEKGPGRSRLPVVWFSKCATAPAAPADGYNVGSIGQELDGADKKWCVSFGQLMPNTNYAVLLTPYSQAPLTAHVPISLTCISRTTSGFYFIARDDEGSFADISGVGGLVFCSDYTK